MDRADRRIAELAVDLARRIPTKMVLTLSRNIKEHGAEISVTNRHVLLKDLNNPSYRDLADEFVRFWLAEARDLSPEVVSVSLRTAAHAEEGARQGSSVELVWTGPRSDVVPFRRTQQAILEVLDSAKERITLVSYAVYQIPHICNALVEAAGRGVRIRVIVETPNKLEGQNEYDTIRALPSVPTIVRHFLSCNLE